MKVYFICLDADIQLDLVNIPWSMSVPKNHGHTWMTSQSLLAVAESSLSYGCLRSSKNLAKARIYCHSHYMCACIWTE